MMPNVVVHFMENLAKPMNQSISSHSDFVPLLNETLVEAFVSDISRTHLVSYIRKSDSLRNRCFPGFRITNAFPTVRQLAIAYRREIVDRKNEWLASALLSYWIARHIEIVKVVSVALNINEPNSTNANEWTDDAREKLPDDQWKLEIRKLISVLTPQFPDSDIHIVSSFISRGIDQLEVQSFVGDELGRAANEPSTQKLQIERDIQTLTAEIESLRAQETEESERFKAESERLQLAIDNAIVEHAEVEKCLAHHKEDIASLTNQIEEINTLLGDARRARDAAEKQERKLSKTIGCGRDDLKEIEADSKRKQLKISSSIGEQSARAAKLTGELEVVLANIQAAENAQASTNDDPVTIVHPVAKDVLREPLATSSTQELSNVVPVENLGYNAICYQGLQRIFRNAVVSFLRERFGLLYPDDHIDKLKRTFGEEWDKAARNAALSRESLGTNTAVRDEYDLLGTNHFFNLFDRHYDKLFTSPAGRPTEDPRPVKTRFLGNLKAIKDGRDPLSHPVHEDISFEEANHLLYAAQEVLKWIGAKEEAFELAALAVSLRNRESETFQVLRKLPTEDSVYLEWVGRNALLQELADCFANPDGKRCLLAGDGGKGKSAVAYRFVQSISPSSTRYQVIIWLSAKKRRFNEGTPTSIETPDFSSARDAIDRLLTEYGATVVDMSKDAQEKKRLLFEYLNDFPAFIVADDIDTVLEDDELVSLFTHEIPHTQSSVLLTSRRSIPGIRSLVVPGFNSKEAEEFIKSRIRLYGLNATGFSAANVRDITKVTDGSPLYIDDLMRLTKIVDVQKAISIWTERGGDEARKYALQREVEKLSVDAKKCLIAAAIHDDPISFAELESILEISEDRLVSALSELQTLFLFPKAPAVEGEQRYQINGNTKKLVRFVEGTSQFYERINTRSKVLAGQLPEAGRGIVGSLITQARLRLNSGQFVEAETILIRAIEKYPNAADLRGVLGYIYRRVGRIADARAQFLEANKLSSRSREMFLQWQKLEIAEKEWMNAITIADTALKVLPELYEIIERKVFCLRQLGFDLHRGTHYEKAAKRFAEAVDEVKRHIKPPEALPSGARELNASMYYSVVVCLDMLNLIGERNHWLERWSKEHPDDPQISTQKEYLVRKRGSL